MNNTKRFTEKNEDFTCLNCNAHVPIHPTSSRDHCNNCLYGLHVDINPGDRANNCKGLLVPIGIDNTRNRERIVYRCQACGNVLKNIVAPDDDRDVISKLYTKVW